MADVLNPNQRRRNMQAIRSKNTRPELFVRRVVHALGFRFRIHQANLPGKPDLVFAGARRVILVHGCYWHMHRCRFGRVVPKTNAEFWRNKRLSNVARDKRNLIALREAGWTTFVVWECWLRRPATLRDRLSKFLSR